MAVEKPVAIVIKKVPLEDRIPTALYCDDDSLTVQSLKDECDINKIIARVARGGDVSHVESRVAKYGDFSNVPSYQEALDLVNRARGFFMDMSPEVRERFANDPGRMIAFLQDEKNYDEAVELGLVVPKKVEETPKVEPPEAAGAASNPTPPPASAEGAGK